MEGLFLRLYRGMAHVFLSLTGQTKSRPLKPIAVTAGVEGRLNLETSRQLDYLVIKFSDANRQGHLFLTNPRFHERARQ